MQKPSAKFLFAGRLRADTMCQDASFIGEYVREDRCTTDLDGNKCGDDGEVYGVYSLISKHVSSLHSEMFVIFHYNISVWWNHSVSFYLTLLAES